MNTTAKIKRHFYQDEELSADNSQLIQITGVWCPVLPCSCHGERKGGWTNTLAEPYSAREGQPPGGKQITPHPLPRSWEARNCLWILNVSHGCTIERETPCGCCLAFSEINHGQRMVCMCEAGAPESHICRALAAIGGEGWSKLFKVSVPQYSGRHNNSQGTAVMKSCKTHKRLSAWHTAKPFPDRKTGTSAFHLPSNYTGF